ncbi:MAG TPA: DUF3301 domain-containing protein [Gammaproteobacteria bacterium]|nr:DUF3301 domain-containing protein [Gammaproteobacteria bacterium]
MGIILVIVIAVATGWLWNDTLKAREQMLARCRRACNDLAMQLLDETVAVHRVGFGRTDRGRIALRRTYEFEFSADGKDRWAGRAILLGRRLEMLQMETPDGLTIVNGRGQPPHRTLGPRGGESHWERYH